MQGSLKSSELKSGLVKTLLFAFLSFVILFLTILPNSIERQFFVVSIEGDLYPVILLVSMLLFFSSLLLKKKISKINSGLSVLFLLVIIFAQINASLGSSTNSAANLFFAFGVYFCPVVGLAMLNLSGNALVVRGALIFGCILIIGAQGVLVLINSQLDIFDGLAIIEGGTDFRQGFSTYRFGSTAAAANTSANILALLSIPAIKLIEGKKNKKIFIFFIMTAIIGFQSRSGIVIFLLALLASKQGIEIKKLIKVGVFGFILFATILFLRADDEIESSNSYRLYLAFQSVDTIVSSSPVEIAFGHGPSSGIPKNLNTYYGQESISNTLLISSESALLTILVEIGIFGLLIFLLIISRICGNIFAALAFFLFLAFDPSFLRQYEAILTITVLSAIGGRSYMEDFLGQSSKKF